MAAIIATEPLALASTGVSLDATAQVRYLRARFANTGASTRVVTVKVGASSYAAATQVDKFTLQASGSEGSVREYGPISVKAANALWAGQDAGVDIVAVCSGEYL